ncbi:MAG: hypothetical protein HRT95_03730 [Moritella sp.]|uniref:hypothetical protein n=1 Tax=Moritella sp. TaxID=78556 RepID=UPI001DF54F40|nr:hypothetical protein [Moritella sp.]NQZ49315.1 hypothetical protein [Moritella sp.]
MTIKPIEVVRDTKGMFSHPDFPAWDDNAEVKEMNDWFSMNNGAWYIDSFESNGPEEMVESWFDNGDSDCTNWQPICDKPGAFLLSIHDTKEGPVGLFFVPHLTAVEGIIHGD